MPTYKNPKTPDYFYNQALDLFIESVMKPDNELRTIAANQYCYDDLMNIRQQVLDYLGTIRRK